MVPSSFPCSFLFSFLLFSVVLLCPPFALISLLRLLFLLLFFGLFSSFLTCSSFICLSWRRSLDLDYHSDAFERSPPPHHIPAKPAQLLFPLSHLSVITLHDLGPVATCMTSFLSLPMTRSYETYQQKSIPYVAIYSCCCPCSLRSI